MNAYLHIPFCSSFCSYCDFVSFAGKEALLGRYVECLQKEISSSDLTGPLRTVYFGGGTPSKLEPDRIRVILDALRKKAGIVTGAEITLEANPDTIDQARLAGYRQSGITRISLGAQTHFGTLLHLLGRRHDWAQVRSAVAGAREAGIPEVGVDLMTGLPGQTTGMVEESMKEVLDLGVDHLSVYSLQLEPGTTLERRVREGLTLPSEDEVADQYEKVQAVLADGGFEQYEVSNWCRPGHPCRHNLAVWQGEDYWGFGVSAVGTQGEFRRTHTEDLDEYLDAMDRGLSPIAVEEHLDPSTRAFERMMLMLRTSQGIHEEDLGRLLAENATGAVMFESYLKAGWLVKEGGRVHPTPSGFIRLNGILSGLMA